MFRIPQNRRIKENTELKGHVGISGSKSWPSQGSCAWEPCPVYTGHRVEASNQNTAPAEASGTDLVTLHHGSDPLSPVQKLPASFITQQMKPPENMGFLIIGSALPIYCRASFTKKLFPATDSSLPYWGHWAQFRNTMKLLWDMLLKELWVFFCIK